MEDAEGEVLSLTEEYPSNDHFQAWIRVSDSSFTSCKPLAFRFCLLRVTKWTQGVWLIKSQVSWIFLDPFHLYCDSLGFFSQVTRVPCKVNKFVTAKKHVSDAKRGTAAWQSTLLVDWHVNFSWGWTKHSCRVTFAAGTGVQVQTSSSLRSWRRQTSRVTLRALIANDFSYCSLKLRLWYFASWCMLYNSQAFVILLSKVIARYCKQNSQLEKQHDWHWRAAVCILLYLLETLGYQYVS